MSNDYCTWLGDTCDRVKLLDVKELTESHHILAEENWKLIKENEDLKGQLGAQVLISETRLESFQKSLIRELDKDLEIQKLLKQIDTLRDELRYARDEHGC